MFCNAFRLLTIVFLLATDLKVRTAVGLNKCTQYSPPCAQSPPYSILDLYLDTWPAYAAQPLAGAPLAGYSCSPQGRATQAFPASPKWSYNCEAPWPVMSPACQKRPSPWQAKHTTQTQIVPSWRAWRRWRCQTLVALPDVVLLNMM